MLVYQRVSHVGCLLTIGFPTLINHLWTLKRDWISSSSVLHSGIVDYTSWDFTPILFISHVFWWLIFGDVHPNKNMSNCLGRGCATQLLLQGSHALRCVFVLLIGVLQRFCILAGKNWLAVARHFPEKRSKVRDLTGLIAVDCPLTLRKFHGFSPSKGNWEMQPKWFFLCRANEKGCVAQEELMKTNGYRKYAAKWGVWKLIQLVLAANVCDRHPMSQ